MPFYRFMVHGSDTQTSSSERGFYTTRHALGTSQDEAAAKVLNRLTKEFTTGCSAAIWGRGAPALEIEKAWRISWRQAFTLANTGSTFYNESRGETG